MAKKPTKPPRKRPGAAKAASPRARSAPTATALHVPLTGPGPRFARSDTVAALICQRIAEGESLRAVCKSESMPGRTAVLTWLAEDATFAGQYARAREAQAEVFADEIIEKADEAIGKTAAEVQAHRLAVDARKWAASKLRPRKYGERGDHGPFLLKLPADMSSALGVAAAADAILRATCAGDLTPAEAQSLAGILETRRRAIESEDLERRLAALEAMKKK